MIPVKLLDEVFVISRIIKVEVRVISRSRRLITLTENLIIVLQWNPAITNSAIAKTPL